MRSRTARWRSRSPRCRSCSRSGWLGGRSAAPAGRLLPERGFGYKRRMAKKILALVAEPVSADALRSAIGDEGAQSAEVRVVWPALNTRRRFFFSAPDPAIQRAA